MNWKVRFHNPVWWAQVFVAVLLPILGYFGLTAKDITTWKIFGDTLVNAISNPYVVVLVIGAVWNACNDPTTKGLKDGHIGILYTKPSYIEKGVECEIWQKDKNV